MVLAFDAKKIVYNRGLKLKVSRRPHETESKVWQAALNNEEFFWGLGFFGLGVFEKIDQLAKYFF